MDMNFIKNRNDKQPNRRKKMKAERLTLRITLMVLAMLLIVPAAAMAEGTAANTPVQNNAVLEYFVGGVVQPAISNDVTFNVDRKVNFTVTANNPLAAASPGLANVVLSFFVNNTGNDTQGFIMDVFEETTDDFNMDANSVRVYLDDGGTPNAWDATDTEYTAGSGVRAFDLAAEAGATVFIVANTPAAAVSTELAEYYLIANATASGTNTLMTNTAGANNADLTVVDTVLADGLSGVSDSSGTLDVLYNNAYSAMGTYQVSAAIVTFTKVINSIAYDPINYNNGNQKAIPHAYVEYLITIENDAAATSSAIIGNITDALPTPEVALINYMDTGLGTASPSSAIAAEIVVDCDDAAAGTASLRTCDAGAVGHATSTAPVTYAAPNLTLDMDNILEVTANRTGGEIAPGDIITIRYMVEIQ